MIEKGRKYTFRGESGKPASDRAEVEIIATDMGENAPVLARFKRPGETQWLSLFLTSLSGRYLGSTHEHSFDLIEVKPERWGLLCFHSGSSSPLVIWEVFASEREAASRAADLPKTSGVFQPFRYPDEA